MNKSRNESFALFSQVVEVLKFSLGNVPLIQSNIKLGLNFCSRAAGVLEKTDELGIRPGVKALGNIVHHRPSRAANLFPKRRIACESPTPRDGIYFPNQFSRPLPGLNVLKAPN